MKRSLAILLTGVGLALPAWAQGAPGTAELKPGVVAKVVSITRVPGQAMLQLNYEITNNGSVPVALDALDIGNEAYGLSSITLMDFKAEQAYTVGTANSCLCSFPPEEPLGIGQTGKFWAWFAPPATSPGPFAVRFGTTAPILDVAVQ